MKKYVKYIGNILVVISLIFIINVVLKFDVDFSIIVQWPMSGIITICSIISILGIVLDAVAGKELIKNILEVQLPLGNLYKIYSKSNIGKYIPGNVMHYVSRGIYCKEYDIKSKDMFYITILEIALKVATAFSITLLLSYKYINQVFEIMNLSISISTWMVILGLIVLVIGLLVLLYYRIRNIRKCLRVLVRLIGCIVIYGAAFFINAIIFIVVVGVLSEQPLVEINYLYVIGIYTMAWLVGYMTPGAPGGVGIKETITLVLLAPIFGESMVLLAAVITRIISVCGDILAYLIGISKDFKMVDFVKQRIDKLES